MKAAAARTASCAAIRGVHVLEDVEALWVAELMASASAGLPGLLVAITGALTMPLRYALPRRVDLT
ncbi:hypothetical protein MPRM_36060 [Mycobacterium parmense]|uniref:Uncharacterized protein n=1 Tax=Mycobacterium parmense TaxID=185642 RepID=A0A7I7YWP6_9MYCO|nr:hypothetical protein MPRM_36060 [Mycobacterium parmense]